LFLYGTLLRLDSTGKIQPGLAEAVDVVDSSNLVVKLKPGLVFSDGTPLDADALKFSWERLAKEAAPGGVEAEFREFETLTVKSKTDMAVKLKTPIAGAYYRLMRLAETSPVSPTAVRAGGDFNAAPVGAGPFKLTQFQAGQTIKFVKNDKYWNAKNVKLAGIEYINVGPQAVTTALRSGTVDFVNLAAAQLASVQGVADWDIVVKPSNGVQLVGFFCKSRPPFDNLKVRQAFNYAIDRKVLNDVIFGGKGEPMNGFNSSTTPFYDKSLVDTYTYNPAKAKQLLAEAGAQDLSFTLLFPPGTDGQQGSEVLQQQLAAVGVKANLRPATGTTDFFPDAVAGPMYFFSLIRIGLPKVTRTLVPGTFGNPCGWNDPELNDLVAQLRAVPETSPEGIKLWQKISEYGLRKAVWLFGVFGTQPYAVNKKRIAGVQITETASGTPMLDIDEVYVKK
jgi:peptide/nickel transport system substrate-binding protein